MKTLVLLLLLSSLILVNTHMIYECYKSYQFYKRMNKQHDEFMKSLEKEGENNEER